MSEFSSRNPPPSSRQLLTLVAILGSLILIGFAILVWLVNLVMGWIPVEVEQQIGRMIVPFYEQQAYESITQTQLNQRLDKLESYLTGALHQNRDYRILYIPNDTVNAIAIPGDVIVIYQGLLQHLESENELTMILGHELGHFEHRDHLHKLGKGLFFRVAIASFLGNSSALESLLTNGITLISNAQYSQHQEIEADRFGLDLLYQNYGHVAGATDFFKRLSLEKNRKLEFLSTHPAPQKRSKILESLIQKHHYPVEKKIPLSLIID